MCNSTDALFDAAGLEYPGIVQLSTYAKYHVSTCLNRMKPILSYLTKINQQWFP